MCYIYAAVAPLSAGLCASSRCGPGVRLNVRTIPNCQMSRILYAIQGTGNGHLSRALDVVPLLRSRCDQLDILISGPPADLPLPFEVKYRAQGMGFLFGKKGGINFVKTFCSLNRPNS